MNVRNKSILLTGGVGSFGQAFVKICLAKHHPQVIRIYSRDELKQSEMKETYERNPRLRFFIGDVRDKNRLMMAAAKVDVIVHAAALKQVPSCEYNPFEAVKTNILGSQNIIEAALHHKIPKTIFVSSDKAVNPINLYGATKLCAEKIFVQANSYAGGENIRFAVARYGNVIGSRGSVVPLFKKQTKNGKLTITDKRMTRFWLKIEEGAEFVIKCLSLMQGGEVFVPKIPSIKITDLAKAIAPKAKIKIIGIRPGEKLHEVLISREEASHTKEFLSYFVIEPEFPSWRFRAYKGKKLSDGFCYRSDTNKKWLSVPQIKKLLS